MLIGSVARAGFGASTERNDGGGGDDYRAVAAGERLRDRENERVAGGQPIVGQIAFRQIGIEIGDDRHGLLRFPPERDSYSSFSGDRGTAPPARAPVRTAAPPGAARRPNAHRPACARPIVRALPGSPRSEDR